MAYVTGVNSGNLQVMPTAARMPALNYSALDLGDQNARIAGGLAIGRDLVEHKKNRENELALQKAKIEAAQALAEKQAAEAKKAAGLLDSEIKAGLASNENKTGADLLETEQRVQNRDNLKRTSYAKSEEARILGENAANIAHTVAETSSLEAKLKNNDAKQAVSEIPLKNQLSQSSAEFQAMVAKKIAEGGSYSMQNPDGTVTVYEQGLKGITPRTSSKLPPDEFISTESVPAVDASGKSTGRTDVYGITKLGQRKLIPTLSKASSGGSGSRPAIAVNPVTGNPLTKTEQTRDDRLATKLGDWDAAGGYPAVETRISQAEKSLSDLEEIAKSEKENAPTGIVDKVKSIPGAFTSPTGVLSSATGKALGVFTGSTLSNISDQKARLAINQLQSAARESIKELMGAQFTQKEGDAVIASVFPRDASLDVAMASARQFLDRIKSTAAHRKSMLDYEQEHGTYAGYNGTPYMGDENTKAADFLNGIGFTGAGTQGSEAQPAQGSQKGSSTTVVELNDNAKVVSGRPAAKKLSAPAYNSLDELTAAYKAGKITPEDARNLAISNGWAK